MLNEIIFLTSNFYVLNMLEYFIHKLSHNHKYGGILYRLHHQHHTVDYPPHRLTVKEYTEDSPDTRGPNIIMGTTYYFIVYQFLPLYYYLLFAFQTSLFFYCSDMLHTYYHLEDSPFEKYEWFREKKRLHHKHHRNTCKNLGIVFNYVDMYYGTFNK